MLKHILKGLVLVIAVLLAFTTPISLANDLPPLFEAAPTELEIGETTTFIILYCPGTEPYKAEWDFDADGKTDITVVGTNAQIMLPVTWLYDDCGAYSVILTITDSTSTTFREEKVDYISVMCCIEIIIGDFDYDGDIDIFDFVQFADAYGSEAGDPNYKPAGDFDFDGDIDFYDFVAFADVYGYGT